MNGDRKLNIHKLSEELADSPLGHSIYYYASVPSTMLLAHQAAADSTVRSGAVVLAEEQTAGRGRLDRQWHAPPGLGLLSTTIIKRPHLPANPSLLAMAAGVATADAIATCMPALEAQVALKWPNDVLVVGSGLRDGKVAGILIETSYRGSTLDYALIGIGINANQDESELPPVPPGGSAPTSIYLAGGRRLDRGRLLATLCSSLATNLGLQPDDHSTDSEQHQTVYDRWRSLLQTVGQPVIVRQIGQSSEEFTGIAVDVDPEGALLVAGPDGNRRSFNAGDVTLRTVAE